MRSHSRLSFAVVTAVASWAAACTGLGGLTEGEEPPTENDAATKEDSGSKADTASNPPLDSGLPDVEVDNAPACVGIDFQTAAAHCGRCNHSCLGDACVNGKCAPKEILSSLVQPYGITVNATSMFWTSSGGNAVLSCDKASCNASPFATAQQSPLGVAVLANEVWWVSQSGQAVRSCILGNCTNPTTHVSSQGPLWGLAIDGANAYFTDVINGKLRKCSRASCAATVVSMNDLLGYAYGVVVDGSDLYVARSAGGAGAILKCTTTSCNAPMTFLPAVNARPLAVDATRVYWGDLGNLNACPKSGCTAATVESIVASTGEVTGIAVDATHIWFVDYANNAIKRVAK